jgi:type I restriction enzyme S subunit
MKKLNKAIWSNADIEQIVDEVSDRVENPSQSEYQKFVGLEDFESGQFKIKKWGSTENLVSAMKLFKKGDLLFARRNAYLKRASEVDFDGVCSGDAIVLREKSKIEKGLLTFILNTDRFWEYAIANAAGTMSKRVKWRDLAKYKFLLPPLEEQKQIAALFQSIETAMEQVDGQEKNLKSLRKALINKLTKHNLDFGNLLSKSNCREYTIGDLAVEVPDRTDNPQISGIEKFIGLEDYESGELTIQKFSSTEKLVSAMKLCKQGDVLFARRNAYLKRASLTEFDAVCSGDVIVLRSNEKIILPKFLVLVMNTVEFWDFAIANAAGTMSKRVKWRDLATYTLELPDLKIQEKILELFNQLEKTLSELKQQKTTLKNLKQKLLNEILG